MDLPNWNVFWAHIKGFVTRVREDKLTLHAGAMAYISLLSLVPLVAVLFSLFSAFPGFEQIKGQLQSFVFDNFVPAASDVISQQVQGFATNASKMTALGIVFLVVTALALISSVDRTINQIFRIHKGRRWSVAFAIYWSVLTLGPLLMGASLAITSYVVGMEVFQQGALSGVRTSLIRLAPFLASWAAFMVLYLLVPNKRVKVRHAVGGAVLAAVLFEFSKRAFAFYVAQVPSYQLIYGTLAAIPILFFWIYLCWLIVLLGAELTAYLTECDENLQEEESDDADTVA
ncbi:virulence factor BrkB family protein [Gallaecimonas kandeliae]|uniref:virulence factor BrkB family protein n=1 Tax=Gallaecimonas kandeliae TaxID=3029055 RepID=UPI002649902B|nr:virulence factor BrkB family protein [Gallaecimonas kandeliae]WKE65591.1 virulence factor BrkB family protein [Gallaecimonas kandeliae]